MIQQKPNAEGAAPFPKIFLPGFEGAQLVSYGRKISIRIFAHNLEHQKSQTPH
jgi:hypothetical protein